MSRFNCGGREAPTGMLPDAVRGHGGHGERLTAEDAVRAYELARARDDRALGAQSRWRFEDHGCIGVTKQSAFSKDRSRSYNETGGQSRWQARATFGDGGEGPVDGIWPPPKREDVGTSEKNSVERDSVARNENVVSDEKNSQNDSSSVASLTSHDESKEHLSRTAKDMARRTDAFHASIAAKGPRQVLGPGVNENRWQNRAGEKNDPTAGYNRRPADAHAGRHEDRAFWGDGGRGHKAVSQAEKDAKFRGGSNQGRWEERGKWCDGNYHLRMPNFGHYAPHMGRDVWEAGGYLKLEKGIHEAGYKNGVWDDGLWERRAGWAYTHCGRDKPKVGDPAQGPHGQRPIGPLNESITLQGVWEKRGDVHRDTNGHALRDVGLLGHVRNGADTHSGRWEQRGEWGKERVHPKLEHLTREHEGRWEQRGAYHKEVDGVGAGDFFDNPTLGGPREPEPARAVRVARANREFVAFRDGSGDEIQNDMNRRRGRDLVWGGGWDDDDAKPSWFGETPARNVGVQVPKGHKRLIKVDKENNHDTAEGVFSGCMAHGAGGDGYTRAPGGLREACDLANAKHGARVNHGRRPPERENVEGDLRNLNVSMEGQDAYHWSWSMDAARTAIKQASHARKETYERRLGSHVGIL